MRAQAGQMAMAVTEATWLAENLRRGCVSV